MKKIIQTLLATLVVATAFSFSAKASHLMGGEISWRCLANGQYIFKVKVYRDCNGASFSTIGAVIDVHNYPGLTTLPLHVISQLDVSSLSNCGVCSIPQSGVGAVEEFTLESDSVTLTGVPPTQGWVFSYSNCCRNGGITNIPNAAANGFSLRAIMYPVNGQNVNSYFDSSPDFAEKPATATGVGYDFHYTPFATDKDLDSLVYAWDAPLDSWGSGPWSAFNPVPIPLSPGYSITSPFPGTLQNPLNTGAVLNTATGEITFKSFTAGAFVTVNKVTAYKCGVKCAEIFRDMQVNIILTSSNSAPEITPPFIDSITNLPTLFDTVYAGDFVTFPINVTDTGLQFITLEAAGNEFGGGFTDTLAGCLIAPCATLNPPPPFTVMNALQTTFEWQTSTAHLGLNYFCAYMPNTYYFLIRAKDDFCPAHAFSVAVIAITVLPYTPKPAIVNNADTLQVANIAGRDYQWYKNRFEIQGANTNAYRPTATGNYEVKVIETATGDGNHSDAYHAVTTGIVALENSSDELTISPNPSSDFITITTDNIRLNVATITITNGIGQQVFSEKSIPIISNYSIPVRNYQNGIYFLKISSEGYIFNKKVIVQHK